MGQSNCDEKKKDVPDTDSPPPSQRTASRPRANAVEPELSSFKKKSTRGKALTIKKKGRRSVCKNKVKQKSA